MAKDKINKKKVLIDLSDSTVTIMTNDLVSIVMLSQNDGRYVEETVRSVLAQTYQNWELLFVAEQSDEALNKVLDLRKDEAERIRQKGGEWPAYSSVNNKIKVSYISGTTDVLHVETRQ